MVGLRCGTKKDNGLRKSLYHRFHPKILVGFDKFGCKDAGKIAFGQKYFECSLWKV